MKTFHRNKTREQQLQDEFYNSFYKGGFLNEKLLYSKDRDFWEAFKEMMRDVNTSGIYESILVGTQEIPYREDILQKLVLKIYRDEDLYREIPGEETFVSTVFSPFRIVRCIFIYSPMNFRDTLRAVEIQNTLKKMKQYEAQGFQIEGNIRRFLQDQLQLHQKDPDKIGSDEDLFINDIVTVLVPVLEDGTHYNINGMMNYPYLTDNYHYYKSRVGQIKFSFKIKDSKKNGKSRRFRKCVGYFSRGFDRTEEKGEFSERPIFYASFFKQYYNPFLLFDPDEIQDLITDLYSHYTITAETDEVLRNTVDHFNQNYGKIRGKFGNRVPPSMTIYNPDDSYFDHFKAMKPDLLDIEEGDSDEDDVEEKDEDDMEEDREPVVKKRFSVSRNALSLKTLKSLILGWNGVRYYGFYGHLADTMLKITDINNSGMKGRNQHHVSAKYAPRAHQILKTINSNPDLFGNNVMTNCLDIWYLTLYRKFIFDADTTPGSEGTNSKGKVMLEERFLKRGVDYGPIDPVSIKSETNAGLQASVNALKYYEHIVEYRDK